MVILSGRVRSCNFSGYIGILHSDRHTAGVHSSKATRRLQRLVGGGQQKPRHPLYSSRFFKISAAATAPAELAKGPSASVAVQTVPHHAPSSAVEIQVKDGNIVIGNSQTLIEGLSQEAKVTRADEEGLVLGFELQDGPKSMVDIVLGKLTCQRFLACARCKLWWMTPEWGSRALHIPPETQFMLLQTADDGPYVIALPLIDNQTFRQTLRGPKRFQGQIKQSAGDDEIVLRIESGDAEVTGERWQNCLLLAADMDPFALVERAVAAAAAMSGGARPLREKPLPGLLDVFGWCTWDAFYSRVSARGLHEGLRSLIAGGAPPGFLIIDDGWQCTDVDAPLRQPSMMNQEMLKQLNMPEYGETGDEFIEAELEMLAMGAKNIPQGSALGAVLETLTVNEENLDHHYTRHERSRSSRKEDERLPWRKAKRRVIQDLIPEWNGTVQELVKSKSRERKLRSMDSVDVSESGDLESSVQASLMEAELQGASATRSAVELSLDEDKIREILRTDLGSRQCTEGVNGSEEPETFFNAEDNSDNGNADAPATPDRTGIVTALERSSPQQRRGGTEEASTSTSALSIQAEPKEAEVVQDEERKEERYNPVMWLAMAAVNRVGGLAAGIVSAIFVRFYQYVVDPAEAETWPFRLFSYLAKGVLRDNMLDFFATSGDFTRRLTSVKANPKFSSPLSGPEDFYSDQQEQFGVVVSSLKQLYGLRYIYCWHGLSAYWSGVSADPKELGVAKYNATLRYSQPTAGLVEIEPSMAWNPSVVSGIGVVEDVDKLYNDMHAYLASAGITGVKVDCQAGVGLSGSTLGGGSAVAAAYHKSLEKSVLANFASNQCINCMCHSTENLYRMQETAIARVSDDFYPRNLSSSHPHIAACAFNGFFMSAILHPDWDMFQSKHPAAHAHAAARAVSGAAIYVSDYPGQHDFGLLKKLVLPDGSVLRASLPGRPTADCLFTDVLRDGKSLLKVWNANTCNAVVGAFNLQGSAWDRKKRQYATYDSHPPALSTEIRVRDVPVFLSQPSMGNGRKQLPGQAPGNKGSLQGSTDSAMPQSWVAMRSDEEETMHRLRHDEGTHVSLAGGGAVVVTIAPVVSHSGVHFAALGLPHMLNGGAAVRASSLSSVDDLLQNSRTNRWLSSHLQKPLPGASAPAGPGQSSNGKETAPQVAALVEVHGTGRLMMFCSRAPCKCILDSKEIEYEYDNEASKLMVTLAYARGLNHNLVVVL